MTQSNTSSLRGSEILLESQRGWWLLKSPRMKRFLEEEMGGGIYIEKRERGVVKRDVDPYIFRVGIKRRKIGGRKFREG